MFNSRLVVGYTTQDHLLVDLDKVSQNRAIRICMSIQNDFPDVGACMIVQSSRLNYHLIFDNRLSWDRIVFIIKLLADVGLVQKEYAQVRTFRRDLTLRISEKIGVDRYRPVPVPVCYVTSKQSSDFGHGINIYSHYLEMFNNEQFEDRIHAN